MRVKNDLVGPNSQIFPKIRFEGFPYEETTQLESENEFRSWRWVHIIPCQPLSVARAHEASLLHVHTFLVHTYWQLLVVLSPWDRPPFLNVQHKIHISDCNRLKCNRDSDGNRRRTGDRLFNKHCLLIVWEIPNVGVVNVTLYRVFFHLYPLKCLSMETHIRWIYAWRRS